MSYTIAMQQTSTSLLHANIPPTLVRRDTSGMPDLRDLVSDTSALVINDWTNWSRPSTRVEVHPAERDDSIALGEAFPPTMLNLEFSTGLGESSTFILNEARRLVFSLQEGNPWELQGAFDRVSTLPITLRVWRLLAWIAEPPREGIHLSSSETISLRTPTPVEDDEPLALSLADLEFSTSQEMDEAGFPFNAPDELTSVEGRELERILSEGAPDWIHELRKELSR